MTQHEHDEICTGARRLLRESRQGALGTLMPDGAPYTSLVAIASHPDGSPLLLISRLAVHTRNLLADQRASLLLAAAHAPDPLQEARIMIAARAQILDGSQRDIARRRYLAAQPSAALFANFPDFLFVKLQLEAIHLVAGFGRIRDLTPADVLTVIAGADAVLDAEESAVVHMNEDHADALQLYATRLLRAPKGDWRCTGIDPEGIDLAMENQVRRLNFATRVTNPGALRAELAALAARARSA